MCFQPKTIGLRNGKISIMDAHNKHLLNLKKNKTKQNKTKQSKAKQNKTTTTTTTTTTRLANAGQGWPKLGQG